MTKLIAELGLVLFVAVAAAALSSRIARWLTAGSVGTTTRQVVFVALLAAASSVAAMALTGLSSAWMAEHVDVNATVANPNIGIHSDFVPHLILAEGAIGCIAAAVICVTLIADAFQKRSRNRAL